MYQTLAHPAASMSSHSPIPQQHALLHLLEEGNIPSQPFLQMHPKQPTLSKGQKLGEATLSVEVLQLLG